MASWPICILCLLGTATAASLLRKDSEATIDQYAAVGVGEQAPTQPPTTGIPNAVTNRLYVLGENNSDICMPGYPLLENMTDPAMCEDATAAMGFSWGGRAMNDWASDA